MAENSNNNFFCSLNCNKTTKPFKNLAKDDRQPLRDFMYRDYKLVLLTHAIDWNYFEDEFGKLYSVTGHPCHAHPLYGRLFGAKISYNISGNLYILTKSAVTPVHFDSAEVMKYIIFGGVTNL